MSVLQALGSTLFVTLRTDVVQTQTRSATQEYSATVQVAWSPDDGPDVDLGQLAELTGVDVENYLPEVDSLLPDTLVVPVGHGTLVRADLTAPTCWDELSGRGLDVGLVGEALLGEAFNLAELQASFEVVQGRALIVNYMEILPEWRGARYGLLATELAIRELGRCCDVAAMYPMQPGLADLDERAAANRALSAYWAQLGFVDFNGIMVRDLSVRDADASI